MSKFSVLLSAILLVTSASASPLMSRRGVGVGSGSNTTSIKTKITMNAGSGMNRVIQSDLSRSQALRKARGTGVGVSFSGSGISAGNASSSDGTSGTVSAPGSTQTGSDVAPFAESGFLAIAEVQIGNPPTTYKLIVDTGSSNTFVGANTTYIPTSSSQNTSQPVAVFYGSGDFSGDEFTDDVTLGGMTISAQSIGVASQAEGFNGLDGILGLGPDALTLDTLTDSPDATIPTVTDNLAIQGKAASALVGVSFSLTTGSGNDEGSLDFGTPDPSKFIDDIAFVPITTTFPSNNSWGIDQSITYGDSKIQILAPTSGIVDTGTTLLFVSSDAFQAYTAATGATLDQATGLLTVDNPDSLQSLFFNIGNNTLEFNSNAQIFPRSLNAQIGGNDNATYLIFADMGPGGQGLDFINGFTFLQRFYSVFDTTNSQVGFAQTSQTNATTN